MCNSNSDDNVPLPDVGSGGYPEVRSTHMALSDKAVDAAFAGHGSLTQRYTIHLLIMSSLAVLASFILSIVL